MTDTERLSEIKARLAAARDGTLSRVDKWEATMMLTGFAEDDIEWLIADNERLQAELEKAREETKRAIEYAHREGSNALAQREKIKRLIDNLDPCDLGDQEGMSRRSRVNKFFNPRGTQ